MDDVKVLRVLFVLVLILVLILAGRVGVASSRITQFLRSAVADSQSSSWHSTILPSF